MIQKLRILFILPLILFCLVFNARSQRSHVFVIEDVDYYRGLELFEKQKYGAAQKCFQKIIFSNTGIKTDVVTNSEYYSALCAIELFNEDAEYLISTFISEHPESPMSKPACFFMAKYQYRKKNYRQAIDWFEKVDKYSLSDEEIAEYYFKMGYSYFIRKNMEKAKQAFFEIKDVDNKYAGPAIYYYSHIAYLDKNYETSLQGFLRLSSNETFSGIVPYYIIQIYYVQKKFDEVISYGAPLLESTTTVRTAEIARFIGEAYYQTDRYKESIPFLEIYHEKADNILREDKYQLAYAYYLIDDYNNASRIFKRVTTRKDKLSQNTYYHLADCYLKLGDKDKARMAFSSAGKLDFDNKIKEDALFNYAVITYELSYSPFNEAIKAIHQYINNYPNSPRIDEAYNFLVMAYMNTKNYKAALESLEKIRNKDNSIKKAYQRVAFYRALELFNNLKFKEAISKFDKSLEFSQYDRTLNARCYYWKAEAFYRLKKFDDAIKNYDEFLLSVGAIHLEEYKISHYNLGYCYFKKKEYSNANTWFRKYVNLVDNKATKAVGDAYNRIGDAFFILTNYWICIEYYNKAIETNLSDPDYALFQKGFAYGLLDRHEQKIETLGKLISDYEGSIYVDDALFESGKSYVVIDNPGKAIENYMTIINDYSTSSYVKKALLQLGLVYYEGTDYQKGLNNFKRVIAEFPSTSEARSSLTGIKNIYVDLNQVETYVDYVNSLGDFADVSISEQDSLTYIAAEKLYMSGDCDSSRFYFKLYTEKYKNGNFSLIAHFYKADCDYMLEDYEGALESYNYIISKPKNTFTEEALLGAARISFMLEKFDGALENYKMLEEVAEIKNNLLESRIGQMRALYLLENYSQMIETAMRVIQTEKVSGEVVREAHFKMGKSYFVINNLEAAKEQFRIVSDEVNSIEGAESKYRLAEICFIQEQYDISMEEIYDFRDKNTPHQLWMAKSFILLADVFVKEDDDFQAKATLESVITHYDTKDDGVIDEATNKLNFILEREKTEELQTEEAQMEIKFEDNEDGKYNDLFEEGKVLKTDTIKIDTIRIDTNKVKMIDTVIIK